MAARPRSRHRNRQSSSFGEGRDGGASIAVSFEDKPPFARIVDGFAIHPEHGIVLFAYRLKVGPWIELFREGHYEIETI